MYLIHNFWNKASRLDQAVGICKSNLRSINTNCSKCTKLNWFSTDMYQAYRRSVQIIKTPYVFVQNGSRRHLSLSSTPTRHVFVSWNLIAQLWYSYMDMLVLTMWHKKFSTQFWIYGQWQFSISINTKVLRVIHRSISFESEYQIY